jgi:hypothetical protein
MRAVAIATQTACTLAGMPIASAKTCAQSRARVEKPSPQEGEGISSGQTLQCREGSILSVRIWLAALWSPVAWRSPAWPAA